MESVLVTGASGFIGSHLVRSLLADGVAVVGMATGRHGFERLRGLPDGFTLELADLRHQESVDAVFARHRFTAVYHLASSGVHESDVRPAATFDTNTRGTFLLGTAAVRHGVKAFVHCGSAFEYGPGSGPVPESAILSGNCLYGTTKAAGWLLLDHLHRSGLLPLVTIRPFAVFGPGEGRDKLIPYVIRKAMAGEPMLLTSGLQVRDYIYVADAVRALRMAAEHNQAGAVFNIGAGPAQSKTVRAIVETALRLIGAPNSLCRFGAWQRPGREPQSLVADTSRAEAILGWKPLFTLEDGLNLTVRALATKARPTQTAPAAMAQVA